MHQLTYEVTETLIKCKRARNVFTKLVLNHDHPQTLNQPIQDNTNPFHPIILLGDKTERTQLW